MDNPTGVVFDIKEFALYDGPGLRCTVFLKGCPLRCAWCHNPEGLAPEPEIMRTAAGERRTGRVYDAVALSDTLAKYAPLFDKVEGGVTYSGGEPLMQALFVAGVMERLRGRVHQLLQTSGHAPAEAFDRATGLADLVFFDCKLADPAMHTRFTGVDNRLILDNLARLDRSGVPYRLRLPLIPGVTDTAENYDGLRAVIGSRCPNALGLDLLPYNEAAGGKYAALGRDFQPGYDAGRPVTVRPEHFQDIIREVTVL